MAGASSGRAEGLTHLSTLERAIDPDGDVIDVLCRGALLQIRAGEEMDVARQDRDVTRGLPGRGERGRAPDVSRPARGPRPEGRAGQAVDPVVQALPPEEIP